VFDANAAEGMELALRFALNYYFANRQGYQLEDKDLAVVIVARHKSTAFAYNDAMWAKYGKQLSEHAAFVDPASKEPPKVNFYNTATTQSPAFIDLLVQRGAHFAVCQMSTQTIAYFIARATDSEQAKIVEELNSNLVANAHPVQAGVVAVTRAQERGYALIHSS
jgi:intracellular sulfur oxidation DsrE/DsrF family protein